MPYGNLKAIVGPMFAGKSTALIGAKLREARPSLLLKPAFDTRYGATRVVSHDGLSSDAIAISEWPAIPDDVRVVLIDEVQFLAEPNFRGDVVAEVKGLLSRGVDVVVSGLDSDWRGDAFDVTARLMAMADEIDKRAAVCPVCGGRATKNFKKVRNDKVVELGESDLYEARCPAHWHF